MLLTTLILNNNTISHRNSFSVIQIIMMSKILFSFLPQFKLRLPLILQSAPKYFGEKLTQIVIKYSCFHFQSCEKAKFSTGRTLAIKKYIFFQLIFMWTRGKLAMGHTGRVCLASTLSIFTANARVLHTLT